MVSEVHGTGDDGLGVLATSAPSRSSSARRLSRRLRHAGAGQPVPRGLLRALRSAVASRWRVRPSGPVPGGVAQASNAVDVAWASWSLLELGQPLGAERLGQDTDDVPGSNGSQVGTEQVFPFLGARQA